MLTIELFAIIWFENQPTKNFNTKRKLFLLHY